MVGVIILAIVQGIAEFLPISSSAHLIIFREVIGIGTEITKDIELAFDIALHFGTLLAILVYFFKDFLNIITSFIKKKSNMLIYLIVATIPAALIGVLFEDIIDEVLRGNLFVSAFSLAFVGYLLYKIDHIRKEEKTEKDIKLKDALFIGCAQVFALIPGVSRSGATITAARSLNIDRETSTKFSFYLAAPVIGGASLVTLLKDDTITIIGNNINYFSVGILVSFVTGLIVIEYLLKYIRKNDFKVFMYYRVAIAALLLTVLFI